MILLLADEHFSHSIVKAARAIDRQVDFITVQDLAIEGSTDPQLLEWAAAHNRVIVSFDANTLIGFAYQRIRRTEPMAGLIIGFQSLSANLLAEDLLISVAGMADDFRDQVAYLPL